MHSAWLPLLTSMSRVTLVDGDHFASTTSSTFISSQVKPHRRIRALRPRSHEHATVDRRARPQAAHSARCAGVIMQPTLLPLRLLQVLASSASAWLSYGREGGFGPEWAPVAVGASRAPFHSIHQMPNAKRAEATNDRPVDHLSVKGRSQHTQTCL